MTAATVAAAATAAAKGVEALGTYRQSKAYGKAANATKELADERASATEGIAADNQRREQRNAAMQLAAERADAASSGMMPEGSMARRETDLATRLEDEIRSRTNSALEEANTIRRQGTLEAWSLRQQASNARLSTVGSLLSGVGTVFSAAGSEGASGGSGSSGKTSSGGGK